MFLKKTGTTMKKEHMNIPANKFTYPKNGVMTMVDLSAGLASDDVSWPGHIRKFSCSWQQKGVDILGSIKLIAMFH